MTFYHAFYPNQRLDLRIQPIAHELKLAIRRDKADRPIVLKPTQSHTLMELDVFHLHSFASCCPSRCLKHHFVVQSQAQLRHPGEIAFHFDGAQDLRAQDVAVGGDEEVQGFDNIEEDFVLAVADAL
jgi:hypothetical protein